MKILAKFLLFSVFVFLPAIVYAQGPYCGLAPIQEAALANLITEMGRGRADVFVYLDVFGQLEDGQNCLNDKLEKLKESVEFEKKWNTNAIDIRGNADDIKDMRRQLKQTELNLDTAETKIKTLEDRLNKAEDEIQELQLDFPIPPHRTIRKSDASKPSGFIPDTPATTPHPAIKKTDASKPKAPASKPKAPANKQTPAVKEGTH